MTVFNRPAGPRARRQPKAMAALALVGLLAAACSAPAPRAVSTTVSAQALDLRARTVTLPLLRGTLRGGAAVWYIVLDTSDADAARRRGLNWSAKLANAAGAAVRDAAPGADGALQFAAGAVDFAPPRRVVAGDDGSPFPPQAAEPGARGNAAYSPLYRDGASGHVFNAPVVAFDTDAATLNRFCGGDPDHSLVHDKVVRICPRDGSVTLALTDGLSHGSAIVYLSTDASDPAVAALEGATYAPALSDIDSGLDDAPDSAVEPIFVVVNGGTGADNPERQGLTSALADGLAPLNVVGDVPGSGDTYSPLWDSHPVLWSQDAISRGARIRLRDAAKITTLAARGALSGPNGGPVAAEGVIVNCPMIGHLR